MNEWWMSQKGGWWLKVGMVMGSDFPLAAPIHTFITVGDVEEKVLFMMLLRERVRKIC